MVQAGGNRAGLLPLGGGERRRWIDEFDEPPQDLFEPPPGAHVIQLTEPGGIVAKPPRPR
jgi:hypothetical protein